MPSSCSCEMSVAISKFCFLLDLVDRILLEAFVIFSYLCNEV